MRHFTLCLLGCLYFLPFADFCIYFFLSKKSFKNIFVVSNNICGSRKICQSGSNFDNVIFFFLDEGS